MCVSDLMVQSHVHSLVKIYLRGHLCSMRAIYQYRCQILCEVLHPLLPSLINPLRILEIGVHIRSNLCYLICLRLWIKSRAAANRFLLSPKDLFSFIRAQHVLITILYKYHDPYIQRVKRVYEQYLKSCSVLTTS